MLSTQENAHILDIKMNMDKTYLLKKLSYSIDQMCSY